MFDRKKESLLKHLSGEPMPLLAEVGDVKKLFEDVLVSVIFQELETLYGIRIIQNKEILANCIISTRFGHDSLNDKLDVVCQTIGATHKEIEAQIIIESAGRQQQRVRILVEVEIKVKNEVAYQKPDLEE